MKKPMVTIFADASVDGRMGAAGWGCWVKADGVSSVTHGGAFKVPIKDVAQAELCAIANALKIAQVMGALKGHAMIQSDSMQALDAIRQKVGAEDRPVKDGLPLSTKRRRAMPAPWLKALAEIKKLLAGVTVSVRHVRGHQPGEGRNWVNRECDTLAKTGMQAARARLTASSTEATP